MEAELLPAPWEAIEICQWQNLSDRELTLEEPPLPMAPLIASLVGSLGVYRWGREERQGVSGNGAGVLHGTGVLHGAGVLLESPLT